MGNRRNAEGYYDPTAYAGIQRAEPKKEKDIIRLVYRNGKMELYLHEFFPCTVMVAKKVFPLIKRYAGERDQLRLKEYLQIKMQESSAKARALNRQASACEENSENRKFYWKKAREEQMRYNQAKRNLEFLESGGKKA